MYKKTSLSHGMIHVVGIELAEGEVFDSIKGDVFLNFQALRAVGLLKEGLFGKFTHAPEHGVEGMPKKLGDRHFSVTV